MSSAVWKKRYKRNKMFRPEAENRGKKQEVRGEGKQGERRKFLILSPPPPPLPFPTCCFSSAQQNKERISSSLFRSAPFLPPFSVLFLPFSLSAHFLFCLLAWLLTLLIDTKFSGPRARFLPHVHFCMHALQLAAALCKNEVEEARTSGYTANGLSVNNLIGVQPNKGTEEKQEDQRKREKRSRDQRKEKDVGRKLTTFR